MKLNDTSFVPLRIAVLLSCFCAFSIGAQEDLLPSKEDILEKMKLANDCFINDPAHDPCNNCLTGRRASTIWTRAVYYEGALAYFNVSEDSAALDHAVDWGTFHSWNLRDDNTATTNADNQCIGQCYIDLYRLEQRQERIATIKSCIDMMLDNPSNNFWTWIDAIQMSMPVFAKLAAEYEDGRYLDKMHRLYEYTKTTLGLYNKEDGLWWRDANFINAKSPNGKKIYWSRGNGWVFAALVRVLEELPAADARREGYATVVKEMAAALKKVQRDDGFWNENLADPDHFGGPEVTGTGLFVYGMAWGINNDILDAGEYLPTIKKAWKAIADSAIFPDGKLGYVQGTGDAPGDNGSKVENVTPSRDIVPDFDDYGLGCVLLAGSELVKLVEQATGTACRSYRNTPPMVAPSLRKVFGNRPVTVDDGVSAARKSTVTLYDLSGRIVTRQRTRGDAAVKAIRGCNVSDRIYLMKTVPER